MKCSFYPLPESVSETLFKSCLDARITIVDPRWHLAQIIAGIRSTELLLTEPIQGAIIADALRVPWISIYGNRGHEAKWYDWCGSMDMIWSPIDANQFTLSWARSYAVPQLSALSVHTKNSQPVIDRIKEIG